MNTETGNKLITEFMGANFKDEDAFGNGNNKGDIPCKIKDNESVLMWAD